MKLRNKVYISIGLIWLLISGLIYLSYKLILNLNLSTQSHIHYFFYVSLALGFLFFILTLYFLHLFIFKRLAKFHLPAEKSDEFSALDAKLKILKDANYAAEGALEQRIQERTQELQIMNAQLQQSIHEHEQAERELIIHKERLLRLAHYDNLTSLPNRIFFNEIFNKALNHAKQHNNILALLFMNLDHFRNFNRQYKRKIGNIVLKELSQRFKSALGSDDIIARSGGDEFIVLLNEIENPKIIGAIADKLLHICKKPIKIGATELIVTASVGIAVFPTDGQSVEELQIHADMAMYKAKHSGGDTYQYYQQAMDLAINEQARLSNTLQRAILRKEFILHYQPQLSLQNGKIKVAEALLRWQHPELGLIGPEKFIHLAEESGLIMEIGEFVLRNACMTNKNWQREGYDPIIVAVNISAKQVRHQDIVKMVENALKDSELNPANLCIEIPESAILENVDVTLEKLKKIHAMGVQIALDDFGTATTAISFLKQISVDILKIDQTYIKGIPYNQHDTDITNAVITLGHNLDLKIVAKGVESTEQIQYLAEHNCDLIQGYFISRPLPANKIALQFSKKGKTKDTIVEQ